MSEREITLVASATVIGILIAGTVAIVLLTYIVRRDGRETAELKLTISQYRDMVIHALAVQRLTVRRAELAEREVEILRGSSN